MEFTERQFSFGSLIAGDTRTANWSFRAVTAGEKNIMFRIWSGNGGTLTRTVTVTVS